MRKPASRWDKLPDESVQQQLMSFNQRMVIGFYYFFNRYYLLFFAYTFIKLQEKRVSEKIVNDSFMAIWTGKKTFKTADDLKYDLLLIVSYKCNPVCTLEADKLYIDGLEMFLKEYYKLPLLPAGSPVNSNSSRE